MTATSYPKGKIKILLMENVHQVAVDELRKDGFSVTCAESMPMEALIEEMKTTHVVGIRSKTPMDAELLKHASKLLCVGCFCIGTDRVDLPWAAAHGIPVFNAPFSNTRSVAELVICEIIALSRGLIDRSTECHRGAWFKVAKGCYEVRGKQLGIVGYGHVGMQLSILAENIGLKVKFYDVSAKLNLGNAEYCETLDELLAESDYISVHVPRTDSTRNMFAAPQFAMMKPGSFFINAARGEVMDPHALAAALKSGHLQGCAVDVYPTEPAKNAEGVFTSPLQGCPNTILTPHIGGSTIEAQRAIGLEVANAFKAFINTGATTGAVNFPNLELPLKPGAHRILNMHKNVPGVLSKINNLLHSVDANVTAQLLGTDENIGYVIIDVNKEVSGDVLSMLQKESFDVKTRVLI
mmetsp:Transcript_43331/g.107040  ORF Transcript_43331/g.107040 Transcript_43331/m.107040 type:complete len:409 (-) Transcript_43331:139-1365(-)|eukprot:CAMPEP_0179847616 /NCGR_PEP_ID=MMETSP0982-20121206/6179_1 /TAXON_ID=483367 /ORGANISM="non described non described, Strain CCMP 2436" /LENGTH=408 /DNA_ID=CAMNT_0021732815 /DNA_START=56 /DNA_END=1282 /DNA_ORIENTATION=-